MMQGIGLVIGRGGEVGQARLLWECTPSVSCEVSPHVAMTDLHTL